MKQEYKANLVRKNGAMKQEYKANLVRKNGVRDETGVQGEPCTKPSGQAGFDIMVFFEF